MSKRPTRPRPFTPTPLLLSVVIFLTGCWDMNETFENCPFSTAFALYVTVDFGVVFDKRPPRVREWYNNVQPVRTPERLGGGKFRYCFAVNVPPGGSVHVGAKLEGDFSVKLVEWEFAAQPPQRVSSSGAATQLEQECDGPGLSLQPSSRPGQGLVLEISVTPNSPGPVAVEMLQWTATGNEIPLTNLVWGDPVLDALAWEDVTNSFPFDVLPGAPPLVFDIPDESLLGMSHGLVRSITSAAGVTQEGVFQGPIDEFARKCQVCHIPGGDRDQARTLTTSCEALPAHLAHGDTLGPCR